MNLIHEKVNFFNLLPFSIKFIFFLSLYVLWGIRHYMKTNTDKIILFKMKRMLYHYENITDEKNVG